MLNEQGEFAPITVHTSAVLAIAGTDDGALWSTGMLRTSWMPDPAPAVTSVQLTAEQHKHKQLSRLLAHASRLAVAQTWSLTAKSSTDSSRKRGHLFLIAGLVDLRSKLPHCCGERKRPPDPESTDDPDDWSFGLQFDIVQLSKTLDPSLRNLSCTRSLPPDPNGRYRAGVAVSTTQVQKARGLGHADLSVSHNVAAAARATRAARWRRSARGTSPRRRCVFPKQQEQPSPPTTCRYCAARLTPSEY